jgi:hypothetical protein
MSITIEQIREAQEAVEAADLAFEQALESVEARTAYEAAKAAYRDLERAAFAEGFLWTCGRCDGTGRWVGNGGTCFNCGGSGFHPTQTPHKFDAEPRIRAKRHAEFLAEKAAEQAQYETALEALPAPVAAALRAAEEKFERIGGYYNEADPSDDLSKDESFYYILNSKLRTFGNLTEKQIAAVTRGLERTAKIEADKAALQTVAPLAEGRYEIEGEVVSTKPSSGPWGGYKMLVKLADGTKIFGSIPAAIDIVECEGGGTRGLHRDRHPLERRPALRLLLEAHEGPPPRGGEVTTHRHRGRGEPLPQKGHTMTELNATTTREIHVPSISGQGGHKVPAGTRVLVTRDAMDGSVIVSGPEVGATMYVEEAAVDMDVTTGPVEITLKFTSGAEAMDFARHIEVEVARLEKAFANFAKPDSPIMQTIDTLRVQAKAIRRGARVSS